MGGRWAATIEGDQRRSAKPPRCPMRRCWLLLLLVPAVLFASRPFFHRLAAGLVDPEIPAASGNREAVAPAEPAAEETAKPILVVDAGGHTAAVRSMRFTPDGGQLITASLDRTIRVWNVQTGESERLWRMPT